VLATHLASVDFLWGPIGFSRTLRAATGREPEHVGEADQSWPACWLPISPVPISAHTRPYFRLSDGALWLPRVLLIQVLCLLTLLGSHDDGYTPLPVKVMNGQA
jgi:hypothetical protein